jgi:hypothetical protein
MDSMISIMAGLVIIAALIPLLIWALGRLGSMGGQVWEDQKKEIDNAHLQQQINARKPNLLDALEQSEQSGRYDMEVEQLIARAQYGTALDLCFEKLAGAELADERCEMYERYIRVIQQQQTEPDPGNDA